jgi:hypothetical protein
MIDDLYNILSFKKCKENPPILTTFTLMSHFAKKSLSNPAKKKLNKDISIPSKQTV